MKSAENKIKTVCNFYAIVHRLTNTLRTGLVAWGIKAERLESVAEHVYATLMLAFAVNSEFELGIDIEKVALMLAMHELGETVVGDLDVIAGDATREEKNKLETDAVAEILKPLNDKGRVLKLFEEFEAGETAEAKFARQIDVLEACFQTKYYEENGCTDFVTPRKGKIIEKIRRDSITRGYTTMAKAWIEYDKREGCFDDVFTSIVDYVAGRRVF
jgi:putative hydrolase of HD superfamily